MAQLAVNCQSINQLSMHLRLPMEISHCLSMTTWHISSQWRGTTPEMTSRSATSPSR